MPQPIDNLQPGPWNDLGGMDAMFDRHERVGAAVNDQRWYSDGFQFFP